MSFTVTKMSSVSLTSFTKWCFEGDASPPSSDPSRMLTLSLLRLNTPGFRMAHLSSTFLTSFDFRCLIMCYVFPTQRNELLSLTSVGLLAEHQSLMASTLQLMSMSRLWIIFERVKVKVKMAGLF